MVRASSRGVSVVTLRAGGSWRSSTAEKRYLEGGDVERVVEVVERVGGMGSVDVIVFEGFVVRNVMKIFLNLNTAVQRGLELVPQN